MHNYPLFLLFIIMLCCKFSFLNAQQKDSLRHVLSKESLFPRKNDSVLYKKDSIPFSQQKIKTGADSIVQNTPKPAKDTFFLFRKKHTPKGATLRSLVFPGWGQYYNHEYWKVPLAWAAVGIPIYLYIDNTKQYNIAQKAYYAVFISLPPGQYQGALGDDSKITPQYMTKYFYDAYQNYVGSSPSTSSKTSFLQAVQGYRNSYRQYRDYSILAALLLWGLQVADATVFGHLREFDVSSDLSMKVMPTYFPVARIPGITLTMSIK